MPDGDELIDTGSALQALATLLRDDRDMPAAVIQGVAVILERLGQRLLTIGCKAADQHAGASRACGPAGEMPAGT